MPPSRMPERPSRSPSPRSTPPRASSARTRTVHSSRHATAWRPDALHRIRGTGLFPGRTAGRTPRDTGPFPAVHADRIPAARIPADPAPAPSGRPEPAATPATHETAADRQASDSPRRKALRLGLILVASFMMVLDESGVPVNEAKGPAAGAFLAGRSALCPGLSPLRGSASQAVTFSWSAKRRQASGVNRSTGPVRS